MDNWYTVPDLVRALQGKISDDQVRTLCRAGKIPGAFNKGTGRREYWMIPESGWNEFRAKPPTPNRKIEQPSLKQAKRYASDDCLLWL